MAETVHYRSLWILSGLCKRIWHVSAVELQFSKAAFSLTELPLLPLQQKPIQWELCLLQMLQEDNEEEAWTRMMIRDKSVALRGTSFGSASSLKQWYFGFIKSLSTSRKNICCWAEIVRATWELQDDKSTMLETTVCTSASSDRGCTPTW